MPGPTPNASLAPSRPFLEGVRDVVPMLLGVVPFGLVTGISAVAVGIPAVETVGMSVTVFAGAAQLAGIALIGAGSAPWAVWLTTLMVNLRHMVYSASLAPDLRGTPLWRRVLAAALLTDQAYAFSALRYAAEREGRQNTPGRAPLTHPGARLRYYFGVAIPIFPVWVGATAVGALAGARIPPAWGVDFTIPLIFLAMLMPALGDRPSWLAAVVGGALALVLRDLPVGMGLILGGLAGIAAGALAERMLPGANSGAGTGSDSGSNSEAGEARS